MAGVGIHDFRNTRGVRNLAPSQQNGDPVVHEQLKATNTTFQIFECDFLATNGAGPAPFNAVALGSGTANAVTTAVQRNGVSRLRSATTANSGARIGTENNSIVLSGGEKVRVIAAPASFASNTIRFGFHNATTVTDATMGAYFEIVGTSTVVAKTAQSGVRTTSTSNFTLIANTFYEFWVEMNANATSATFTIYSDTGTQLWTETISTNVPSGIVGATGVLVTATNSGTVATDMFLLDYLGTKLRNYKSTLLLS